MSEIEKGIPMPRSTHQAEKIDYVSNFFANAEVGDSIKVKTRLDAMRVDSRLHARKITKTLKRIDASYKISHRKICDEEGKEYYRIWRTQ
jgi:hypothetical protein